MKTTVHSEIDAEIRIVSSLEKIFPDRKDYPCLKQLEALKGERVHFQAVIVTQTPFQTVELKVTGPLSGYAVIHEEVYLPCLTPAAPDDPDILQSQSGLFPGPLLKGNLMELQAGCSHAFWVTLNIPAKCRPGRFSAGLNFRFTSSRTQPVQAKISLPVRIYDMILPRQKLCCEMWFHCDCLLNYYHVKCWSKRCWEILENYFQDMAEHGVDTLLTPLWTPPLDTGKGKTRPTVQLLDIRKEGERYQFRFHRLKKWIDTARKAGIRKFSFSHIFTQWGLAAAPKISVRENGIEKDLFGWHVSADSEMYQSFLRQLFAALLPFLKRNKLTEKDVYFHLSDEPQEKHLEQYRKCSRFIHSLLKGFPTLDALSHVQYFDEGLVECPVVNESRIEDFVDRTPRERWLYYCGEWENHVPNRKFGMSSLRNRILGIILYLYRMDGFLEWGYNFWFSWESEHQDLDPWSFRDILRIFGTSGAFAVLPGKNGRPVSTVHYEVFADALQDLRLLQLLETLIGRQQVEKLLNEGLKKMITIHDWPEDPSWFFRLRNRIIGILAGKGISPGRKTNR